MPALMQALCCSSENIAKTRYKLCQITWITKCWKVIRELLTTNTEVPSSALKEDENHLDIYII